MTALSSLSDAFKQTIADLDWQDHVCLVYDLHREWVTAVVDFLKVGQERGDQCVCLLPEGFFADGGALPETGATWFREALDNGRIVLFHDADALRDLSRAGDTLAGWLAGVCGISPFVGCRIVWDMNWLKERGLSEKKRYDMLLWLHRGELGGPLLTLSGYGRLHTAASELQNAFGLHGYIWHAGQLLPGGFGGASVDGRRRSVKESVPGWRRTFRRSQILDAIFKAAPTAMWMLNRDHEVVFVNRQLCDMLGVSEESLLGYKCGVQQDGAGGAGLSFELDDPAVYGEDGPVEKEQSFLHSGGGLHDYRVIRTRVVGDDGRVEGMLGLALDTTDRKKAERLLRQEERRFRDIALSVGDVIWEVGPDWRIRYLSQPASSILGYPAENLIGKFLTELDDAATGDTWQVLFRAWEKSPTGFRNVEKWLQHPDGEQRCLLLSGVPIRDEEGKHDGFRGVAEDITGRKEQEKSLKRALWQAEDARDKIDSILRSITDALVVIDNDGHVVMLNPPAEKLFGVTDRPPSGMLLYDLCPGAEVRGALMQLVGGGAAGTCEACLTWPVEGGDKQVFYKARSSRVRNIQGECSGTVIIFQDMTREREIERVKTGFISTAAHELRTPLTSIMGYLEFCMHPEEFGGFSGAQIKEFMAEIYDKADVLERIVSDLLDISRMEAGREIPLVMESVNVAEVSRKILQHFQLQFPRYRFELEFGQETDHRVRADREKLVQVMENLISNAVKYSPEGSPVRVGGVREAASYRISVRDKGIGMTPAQIDRMFERFYRAVDVNSGVRGLGLGMHIVKHIIERHGGGIEVFSAPGEGTEITFDLPLCE